MKTARAKLLNELLIVLRVADLETMSLEELGDTCDLLHHWAEMGDIIYAQRRRESQPLIAAGE